LQGLSIVVFFLTGLLTLIASHAFAQTSNSTARSAPTLASVNDDLPTPTGHEVSAGLSSYTYREPGEHAISIHGLKAVGEYAGTASLNRRRHWLVQAQLRSTVGTATYTGWCSPFVITPDNGSPNGYVLGIGDASRCSEDGDADWYAEGRALVGKDMIADTWAWSPYSGLGVRHLSNGTTGVAGYRTDDYLYVPAGVTARTALSAHRVLSFNIELDVLGHGWQHTHDSKLGGGDVPATATAPAFTIDSFTDVAFAQTRGWAVRAGATFPITARWSLQPYYVRWDVQSSAVEYETVAFTVNRVTAREQLGFYEPHNTTSETGVRLAFHF
jgi:hypothetical protein